MQIRTLGAMVALLLTAPIAAHAQSSTLAPTATRREQAQERREAMRTRREARRSMTPEQRAAAKARREARIATLPADQQQYLRDRRSYQQSLRTKARELHAQVTAGTLTRDAMAQQLAAFKRSSEPVRPAGMKVPRRANGLRRGRDG